MIDRSLRERFSSILPKERILDDALSLTAIATDASFYQIRPQIILDVLSLDEMLRVLALCARDRLAVTYRAAGTSLSGQALGAGVLIRLARGWRKVEVLDQGLRIALEPGVIGSTANRVLKRFQRKIGPDPATIQNCMIGGIAANNSSGMCCGTDQNTYRTMDSIKLVLCLDETPIELDTGDAESRRRFRERYPHVLSSLSVLRAEVIASEELHALISKKYKIKNTMGYSLNSLIDFKDPIDILAHLMIGSEGTLGFISEITYRTVPDYAHRSCALLFFETLGDACRAATQFKTLPISAAELMDRVALKKVEDKPGMPSILKTLAPQTTALLIETRAENEQTLRHQVEKISTALNVLKLVRAPHFSGEPAVYELWWNIRRGLFPSVGRGRPAGTTVIIEDVAFPIDRLADAAEELVSLFARHGYEEAILFGHVLDGNLHFSFAQDFNSPKEVNRYAGLMDDLGDLVATRFGGSLKAEHGTGRNMAPFVELEWGAHAYSLMKRIKTTIDPLSIFNPGVLMNDSPRVHLDDLKTTPIVDALIDECIECGFCEVHCPSQNLTVTPRQRIAAFRELARNPGNGAYESQMQYPVDKTCATDGLCAVACPVGIDTGTFVKKYRAQKRQFQWLATFIARNFAWVLRIVRFGLTLSSWTSRTLPNSNLHSVKVEKKSTGRQIVYLPSCISRTMGAARGDADSRALPTVMQSIFKKAGIEVLIPAAIDSLCCGLPFESKGFPKQGDEKTSELEAILLEITEGGRISIVSDTSPCSHHLKMKLDSRLKVLDSVEFVHDLVLSSALTPKPIDEKIAVHVTCSATHMQIAQKMIDLARRCSSQVTVPLDVGCCGFAGDKGFTHPELTRSALVQLAPQVKACQSGFSNSRTCEIGLSREGKIPYQSIAHLVDRVT
jgi:D-lactate dehydrogenase